MTNGQALILGLVQGLTEYLPVSSSAHLVLVPEFLGWRFSAEQAFTFDVLVQLGTLVGVLFYFYQPLIRVARAVIAGLVNQRPFHDEDARLGWLVVLACIPASVIGLAFKSHISRFFSAPSASCYFLILTGVILLLAESIKKGAKPRPDAKDAVFIGFAQTLALFPGVSRSGSTIAAGMARGLSRENAAFFSFILSIPVMVGASMVVGFDLFKNTHLVEQMRTPLLIGFSTAAISGYLVIRWFMGFVSRHPLNLFAAYCLLLGTAGAFYFG